MSDEVVAASDEDITAAAKEGFAVSERVDHSSLIARIEKEQNRGDGWMEEALCERQRVEELGEALRELADDHEGLLQTVDEMFDHYEGYPGPGPDAWRDWTDSYDNGHGTLKIARQVLQGGDDG